MLCPICGMQSNTTSAICPKHISITYDSNGKVIAWQDIDWKITQPVRTWGGWQQRIKEGVC
jgi:hypothetical protein